MRNQEVEKRKRDKENEAEVFVRKIELVVVSEWVGRRKWVFVKRIGQGGGFREIIERWRWVWVRLYC